MCKFTPILVVNNIIVLRKFGKRLLWTNRTGQAVVSERINGVALNPKD